MERGLFENLIKLVEGYKVGGGKTLQEINEIKSKIRCEYSGRDVAYRKQVLLKLKNSFKDDRELHILLLSIFFEGCQEEEVLLEIYDTINESEMELFYTLAIRLQLSIKGFIHGSQKSEDKFYIKKRILNKKINDEYKKYLNMQKAYIPLRERNKNRIVIITNQYLGELHAPTRIINEICSCLKRDIGMEVMLVIASESYDYLEIMSFWIEPHNLNYGDEIVGDFIANCLHEDIYAIKFKINSNTTDDVKQAIDIIYEFNPLCVWYMGGVTVFGDLLVEYTTVIAMPFSKNFMVSEAPILVRYLKEEGDKVKKIEDYICTQNQKIIDITIPYNPKASKYFQLDDFEIPSDVFPIMIVGNRLDYEINEIFLEVIRTILTIDSKVCLIFIGTFLNYKTIMEEEIRKGQAYYLGFRPDLIDVMGIGKLFINPPRQGGGAGAVCALYQGLPIITLGNCDVAGVAGEEFVCEDITEMPNLVRRYFSDEQFYKAASHLAREKAQKEQQYELKNEIKKLLKRVYDLMKEGEEEK